MRLGYAVCVATCAALLAGVLASGCSGEVRQPPKRRDAVIYVSTRGSDKAPGTARKPKRTLRAAIRAARPGTTVLVRGGTYDERPSFTSTGTVEKPVTYRPYGNERVTIRRGFTVPGSYNRIERFTVTPGARGLPAANDGASQVFVSGKRNVLLGIRQRDTYGTREKGWNAMNLSGSSNVARDSDFSGTGPLVIQGRNNRASGGTVHHTAGLIVLLGATATLENMDLHDSGQIDRSGNAADGINLAGDGITIRGNRIYRLFLRDPAQHPDAIQWWNDADGLVIENNRLGSRTPNGGEGDYGHIQFEAVGKSTSNDVVIRNNVFLGTWSSFNIRSSPRQVQPGHADRWRIVGNTFADQREIRGDMLANMRGTVIKNNVFTATQRLARGPGSAYDYNAYVRRPVNASDGPHSFSVGNPRFMRFDFGPDTGYGLRANVRPRAGSPLVGEGQSLGLLPRDASGRRRGSPPTIGAYEPAR